MGGDFMAERWKDIKKHRKYSVAIAIIGAGHFQYWPQSAFVFGARNLRIFPGVFYP